jgi:hypothetical protein
MRKLLVAAVAALAFPAAAAAGGWATAGVEPLPTAGDADDDQTFTIFIRRHGQTPEDGAKPAIVLTNTSTGETKRFPAAPAGKAGVYTATVAWPEGTWRFGVDDGLEATGYGMSQLHTFGTVEVAAAGGGSGGGNGWTIGGSIVLALVLTLLLVLGARRKPDLPAPAPLLD